MSRINLKKAAKSIDANQGHVIIHLNERLPRHVHSVSPVVCDYKVEQNSTWYLLHMETTVDVEVCCLRCLDIFKYTYHNQQTIACCLDDVVADQLMKDYECIVVADGVVNLIDVITDDLHLNVPEMHSDAVQCSSD